MCGYAVDMDGVLVDGVVVEVLFFTWTSLNM
jgi:hypothetical protein